jgi:hypothetical protein
MTRLIFLCAMLSITLVAAIPAAAQSSATQGTAEKPFVSGGNIRMQLAAGDYEIQAGTSKILRVTWRAKRPTSASIAVNGNDATITVGDRSRTGDNSNDIHVTIEVPATSDLAINLSAGDLRIGRISGNKDIDMGAGDLNIALTRSDEYRSVDASVKAGDLNMGPFGKAKSGLFPSFKWNGPGKYSLRIHLGAGDVVIKEGPSV